MSDLLGPCINTTWCCGSDGYGQLWAGGKLRKHHRCVYAVHNKLTLKDIEGKIVMHKCDNRACVNPAHLVLGTQSDNMRDMVMKGRAIGRSRPNNKFAAKLTVEQVQNIRYRSRDPYTELAQEFGVSISQIGNIINRKSWPNI